MYWLMAALLMPCIIATLLAPEPSDVIPVPRWSRRSPNRCAIFRPQQRLADSAAHRPL
jgi:hypothetical protein